MPFYNNEILNTGFIDRNKDTIESILGNVSDIVTKDRYNDFEAELLDYNQKFQRYQTYGNVRSKVLGTTHENDELNALSQKNSVDFTNPDFQGTEYYQKFAEQNPAYVNPITQQPQRGEQDQTAFMDFINQNYRTNGNLPEDLQGFITSETKDISPQEYESSRLLKAGLSDEERALYDEFKGFDIKQYNQSLRDIALKRYQQLQSQGELGGTLAENYTQRLLLNELSLPEQQKFDVKFNSGFKFKFDEFGNEVSREKIKEDKPFGLTNDAKIISYTDSESGEIKYGWFEPDPNSSDFGNQGWKFTGVSSTSDRMDMQNRTGRFDKSKTGGSKRRGGSKGPKKRKSTPNELELRDGVDDLNKVKLAIERYGGWDNIPDDDTGDELKNRYEQLFKKVQQLAPGSNPDDLAVEYGQTGKFETVEGDIDPAPRFEGSDEVQSRFEELSGETEDSNQRAALENVLSFVNDTIEAWQGNSPPPDEWRREIGEESWNEIEWALIKKEFKRLTGEDY